ncbi:fatty acyl-CoA reductase 1, partial [Trichonephila clavata]
MAHGSIFAHAFSKRRCYWDYLFGYAAELVLPQLEEESVLLEILLRCCPGIRDIYILLRSKKGVDPQSRTKELFNRTIFNKLKKDNPDALKKVHVIPGDISKPGLGMSIEDMQKITQEVSIVFHCAASISFLKPLRFLLENNVRATDSIIELCKNLKTCEALVYTSTAYSNCNRKLTIEERIYRLPYPAQRFLELLEKGNDDELMQIASECQPSWPNYYTFSKSISENLIAEKASDIKTAIIRPAVICNVWKGPLPGYAEENSSLAQIFLGFGRGFLRVLEGRDDVHFDLIPVDVIANSHVVAAWHVATNRAQSPHVVNCTSTNAISYKLKEYLSTMQEFLTKETIPNAFREPKTTMWVVKQRFIKELLSIYEHYVPAVFLDLVLLFRGKKP